MRSQQTIQTCLFAFMASALVAAAGCSGGGSSSASSGGNGGGGSGSNTVAITVNSGPAAAPPINEVFLNGAFTSVTVCVPNSSNCQTVSGILVDTGSSGLRILSSAVTLSLPQQTASGGAPVVECLPFLNSITWGPVVTADVTIGGEKAQSLPIQVIGTSQFPSVPTACTNFGGMLQEDLADLGANGILGIGNFAQDCGSACTVSGAQNPGLYYTCAATPCVVTTESLAAQVSNPVVFFATDNNGVMVQFPTVSSPEASVSASMIFGIGTQSNNSLGSATVYTLDPNTGNFTTTFKGVSYTGFLDTGSNAFFFLDSAITGLPECADDPFFYCPSSPTSFSAANMGTNGATGTVNFTISNADALFGNLNNTALPTLGGPVMGSPFFDWGLPFFFGRTVFVSIEGKSAPGGTTPYVAY